MADINIYGTFKSQTGDGKLALASEIYDVAKGKFQSEINQEGGSSADGIVYDVSANNAGATFASLSALLSNANLGTLIPSSVRKGGMQIRFVQTSDNKYVQFRLMHPLDNASTAAADFANTANWQGVDDEPTAGSRNLIESGGVAKENINLVPLNRGKNLFDKNSNYIVSGKYIDIYNTIQSSTNYSISGLIPIKANTDYYISQGNDGVVGSSSGNFRFYDENCQDLGRSFLIDATNRQITTPANAHYIQISYYHVLADSLMINEGNERGDYMPYNPVGGYPFGESVEKVTTDFTLFQKNPTNGASLYLKSLEAVYRNSFFRTNLFDPNDENYVTGKYLGSIGSILNNSDFAISGYVPFFQWMQYLQLSVNGVAPASGGAYICLYDKYGVLVNSYTLTSVGAKATWESGVAYVRFSIKDYQNGNIMIEIGSTIGSYIPFGTFVIKNKIGASDIADNSINSDKLDADSVIESKIKDGSVTTSKTEFFNVSNNLFDVGKAIDNKYVLSSSGNLSDNTAYMASDYIKVIAGSDYYSNVLGDYAWYNSNKVYISGGTRTSTGSTIFTAPEGAVYLRASVRKNYNANQWMIAKSSVSVAYEPYYQYIKDEYINPQTKNFVSSIQGKNALSVLKETMTDVETFDIGETTYNGEVLTITNFPYYMKKGNCISLYADITSFGTLFIGDGLNGYIGTWLKIDATNVVHQQMGEAGTNPTDETTVAHGLTISTFIKISMYISMDGKLHLNLQTLDGTFSTTIETWNTNNGGAIFLATSGCSLANIKMNLSNSDFRRPVWAFGDSYFGFNYNRVMGCLSDLGFMNFLINGFPGNNSQLEYQDLERCMSFGTPKYILWCLGMNDTDNGFQTYFDKVIKLCQDKNITLIGYIVPTVPTRNKETINQYVKDHCTRYVDAYKAVGANSSGIWYTDYLSSDGVHPTELGAKAIAMQILTDFSEVMQYGLTD